MIWGDDGGLGFAEAALALYPLPEAACLKPISLGENATFLVSGDDEPLGVLRIYRPGAQTGAAKCSELAWIDALQESRTVRTPGVLLTCDGDRLGKVQVGETTHSCVLFEYVAGEELGRGGLVAEVGEYRQVGGIAARLHNQVGDWTQPSWFERIHCGLEDILGPDAHWGSWKAIPNLSDEGLQLIEEAEALVRARMGRFPMTAHNSGLIHADLRVGNLLQDDQHDLWVIDFDDAVIGWFLWDLGAITEFNETSDQLEEMVEAWLEGYREHRPLAVEDVAAIPDIVFLRRLHVLAWLGSHLESSLGQELSETYGPETIGIARQYLDGEFLARYLPRSGVEPHDD